MPPKELEATSDPVSRDTGPRAYCPVCHQSEPGRHGPRCRGIGEGSVVGYGPTDRWLKRH